MVEENITEGNSTALEKDEGIVTTEKTEIEGKVLTEGQWASREIALRKKLENKYENRYKEKIKEYELKDATELEKLKYENENLKNQNSELLIEKEVFLKLQKKSEVEQLALKHNSLDPKIVWDGLKETLTDSDDLEKIVKQFLHQRPYLVKATMPNGGGGSTGYGSKVIEPKGERWKNSQSRAEWMQELTK